MWFTINFQPITTDNKYKARLSQYGFLFFINKLPYKIKGFFQLL